MTKTVQITILAIIVIMISISFLNSSNDRVKSKDEYSTKQIENAISRNIPIYRI